MQFKKNMKFGISFIFLLLLFTASISLIDFKTKSSVFDENSLSTSVPEDPYEENDIPTFATNLTSYEGWWLSAINGSGAQWDEDWYMINVNPGKEHLRIILLFDHLMGDINLQLHNSNFSWGVSRTSVTMDEFMDVTVPGPGLYFIQVYFGNMGNWYDLWYNTTFIHDDSFEENDQEYETYDLRPDEAMWQYNLRQFDDDWFEIHLDTGEERLKAQLYILNHLAGNIDLEVYDWNFNYIDGSYSPGDTEYLELDLFPGGTYYLRVFGNNMGNEYDLFWEDLSPVTTGGDDWAEVNDDFNQAFWLGSGHYSDLWIIGYNNDWFQLDLNHGDKLDVGIFFFRGDGDLKVQIYDPSNTQRNESYSYFDNEHVSFISDMSGSWRIRVFRLSGSIDMYYNLDIWINNGGLGDDPYEFNNNPYDLLHHESDGNDPTGGKDSIGRGVHPSNLVQHERTWLSDIFGLAVQGDEDWYAIEVTPGFLNLEVKLSFNHSLGDIDMEIHILDSFLDTSGNPQWSINPTGIGSYSVNNSEYINTNVLRGGIYFIRVYFGNGGNEYNLWWDDIKTRDWDDAFESNNAPSNATDIMPFKDDHLGIARVDFGVQYNNDYYSLEINEGFERLRVLLKYDVAEGVMGLEIYDHELNKLTGNFTLNDNDYIDYEVPSNGTYYIRVYGDNSGNTYNLFWEAWETDNQMIPGYDILILIASIFGISVIMIKIKRSKFKHQ
ncbi:MAG: hypothetical protein ACW98D_11790 [Promethearchaeota archaeon]|jgi:hypothetical protein